MENWSQKHGNICSSYIHVFLDLLETIYLNIQILVKALVLIERYHKQYKDIKCIKVVKQFG